MFGVSSDNPDIPCPDCRRILVEVRGFSRVLGLDTGIHDDTLLDIDSFSYYNYGYMSRGEEMFILFQLFNGLIDGVLGWFHKQKARRLCRKLLSEAPRSLICASCLYVLRRK